MYLRRKNFIVRIIDTTMVMYHWKNREIKLTFSLIIEITGNKKKKHPVVIIFNDNHIFIIHQYKIDGMNFTKKHDFSSDLNQW